MRGSHPRPLNNAEKFRPAGAASEAESHYIYPMRQYLDLMRRALDEGVEKSDRTGTGTLSVFGHQMRFDLAEGFPLVTTKKLHVKSIIHELLWFLAGDTNTRYLTGERRPHLGRVGGRERRPRPGLRQAVAVLAAPDGRVIDQISDVIAAIRKNPDSRRLIVSAWNPADIDRMALAPCHCLFQFYVVEGRLSCQLYQRSGDIFLGVPFNIASYALLTLMMAQVTGLRPGDFVHTLGDAHLYLNHLEQAREQLTSRAAETPDDAAQSGGPPHLRFRLWRLRALDYDPHPHIKAAVVGLSLRHPRRGAAGCSCHPPAHQGSRRVREGCSTRARATKLGSRAAFFFGERRRAFCDIAEVAGEPVGYAIWLYSYSTFSGRHGIYLEDLFVLPEHRGSGIGKALLQSLAKRCVREGL